MAYTTSSSEGAHSASRDESRKVGAWSGWAYFAGFALVVIGVLAMFQPILTGLATAVYLGAMLTVSGAFALVGGLANIKDRGAWVAVLLGLLSIAVGALVLYNPVTGVVSLALTFGAWLVAGGILEVVLAFSVRQGRGWLLFIGVLDVVLGGVLLMMKPGEALVFIGYFTGASLIYRGVWSLVFASNLRRIARLTEEAGA